MIILSTDVLPWEPKRHSQVWNANNRMWGTNAFSCYVSRFNVSFFHCLFPVHHSHVFKPTKNTHTDKELQVWAVFIVFMVQKLLTWSLSIFFPMDKLLVLPLTLLILLYWKSFFYSLFALHLQPSPGGPLTFISLCFTCFFLAFTNSILYTLRQSLHFSNKLMQDFI